MKRLTTIIAIIFILLFIGTTFYVFDIPPLNQKTINKWLNKKDENQNNKTKPKNQNSELPIHNITFQEHINKGDTLTKNGFFDLAIKEYQTANELNPKSIIPLIKIGKIHLQKGNFVKAQLSFEAAITADPENLEAQINLGRTLIAQRKINEARKIFNTFQSENSKIKYYKTLMAILEGDHDTARKLLKETTEPNAEKFRNAYKEFDSFQSGSQSHLKTLLARSFTEAEEFQMAIPLLFEVIKEKSDYRDAWILLGYSYLKTGKAPESIDALEEAKKLDPQKPETLFFLGLSYFNNDELEKASNNLEDSIENGFEPRVQAEQKLAEIYSIQKKYKEAAKKYENVLSLNDSKVEYFVRPIWIYLNHLNKPDKAYILARKAVEKHPNSAMSHNLLGWVNLEKNKDEIAKNNLITALKINPNLDAAHLNLGRIYDTEKKYNLAKEHYQKAYELGKGSSISKMAAEKFKQIANKQSTENKNFKVSTLE